MRKIVKLTESDLVRLVNKVINEQVTNPASLPPAPTQRDARLAQRTAPAPTNNRITQLVSVMKNVKQVNKPVTVISDPNSQFNNMEWQQYIRKFKITPEEIKQAQQLLRRGQRTVQAPQPGPPAPPPPPPGPKAPRQ